MVNCNPYFPRCCWRHKSATGAYGVLHYLSPSLHLFVKPKGVCQCEDTELQLLHVTLLSKKAQNFVKGNVKNKLLISLSRNIWSYQFYIIAHPLFYSPSLYNRMYLDFVLLHETLKSMPLQIFATSNIVNKL